MLPAAPPRAALEGLALYDAVAVRQAAYLLAGRTLIRSGLGRLMAIRGRVPLPDHNWWTTWLADVVVLRVGPIASAAFRLLGDGSSEPDRFTCLLFDPAGSVVAFGKAWRTDPPDLTDAVRWVLTTLGTEHPTTFSVPALLDAGTHRGRAYVLQAPLPSGGHSRMKPDAARLRSIIAEFQDRVRPALGPAPQPDLVPVHGSFTPLNVRIDRHGRPWLLDWDKLSWGPPLYDELRYWISDLARRGVGSAQRRARQVLHRMGPGLEESRLRRALAWRIHVRGPEVLTAEQQIRDGLFELLDSS